jgi:hypothetical protein
LLAPVPGSVIGVLASQFKLFTEEISLQGNRWRERTRVQPMQLEDCPLDGDDDEILQI